MSYALSTTKRKFHRILDSISNSSSASLNTTGQGDASTQHVSTHTLPHSPAKRPRLTLSKSMQNTPSSSVGKGGQSALRTTSDKQTTMDPSGKAPYFTPWDREKFLERLQTFRHVDKWMSKPEMINEVQWAKRGWVCIRKERVGCVGGCGKEVVIKIEDDVEEVQEHSSDVEAETQDWRAAAKEQLVEKYTDMIVSEHAEGCFWRTRGCDDTIYRLPLTNAPKTLHSLSYRYQSLAKMASELPQSLSVPDSFNLQALCEQLPPTFLPSSVETSVSETPSLPENTNRTALTLALFGWHAETGHIDGLATCSACFRRLGLWLFKQKFNTARGEEDDSVMSCLDVVGEHREYCPWVNANSQNGGSTQRSGGNPAPIAGWETLLGVITLAEHTKKQLMPPPPTPNVPQNSSGDPANHTSSEPERPNTQPENIADRDAKDKERWAKLAKLKQVFNVKSRKRSKQTSLASNSPPSGTSRAQIRI